MKSSGLLTVYQTVIRPFVEYCSIIYHPLIPNYLADQLESVQKLAIKTIYGSSNSYKEMVQNGSLELLSDRREAKCLAFALKASRSARFGTKWFKEAATVNRAVRTTTRNKYVERFARTERMRGNPLLYMTRALNKHLCSL